MNLTYKYQRPTSVIYYGHTIQVPSWAKWMAIDKEGFLWVYRLKPVLRRAARYRASGEEEKVLTHRFQPNAQWQDSLCPVMDCQWMIDVVRAYQFNNGVSEETIRAIVGRHRINQEEYQHFAEHAAPLLDEDGLEFLQECLHPDKTVLGFLKVPYWAEWLCISSNGTIAVFDKEPKLLNGLWIAANERIEYVGTVENYDDWAKSKTKLPASC